MAPSDEQEDAEARDQDACRDLDFPLPCEECSDEGEGNNRYKHCQQVADAQIPQRDHEGTRTSLDHAG
jgi:hypothetical protein